jgi:pyruvate dehydrogenase E2 component (dihydrolipoamide acetyltransferase)
MPQSFKLPDLGEGIHEGEVLKVLVAVGDRIKEGEPIMEVETDKAAVEIPSPYTGSIAAILVKAGDVVHVGDVLMTFEVQEEIEVQQAPPAPAPEPATAPSSPPIRNREPVPAAPATRKLARELGIDLHTVNPSGPQGLVTAEDVRRAAGQEQPTTAAAPPTEQPMAPAPAETLPGPLPDFSKWGPVQTEPLRSIRRTTARQMTRAWTEIPHVATHDTADVTALDAFRRRQREEISARGGHLTLTVFVLKAVAAALKKFPSFNASLDSENEVIIFKQYYHVGVAVDTPGGLLVPVIRDVDRKSITDLALELSDLVQQAHARKTAMEALQGGTFSITNAGAMGGESFTPIINYPEVAILGMGQARQRPVVIERRGGRMEIVPRLTMSMVVCFDHRVNDGVAAIRFLRYIIEALEDPDKLLMTIS